jgi:hypothetical protein
MNALILMLATTAVSVEAGWTPLADGGVEYIIQIEPQALDTLLRQSDVESEIPPNLDVRRVRITVGTSKLPRVWPSNAPNPNSGGATPGVPTPAVIPGVSTPPAGPGSAPPASGFPPNGSAPGGGYPGALNTSPISPAPPPATLGSLPGSGSSGAQPSLVNNPSSGFPAGGAMNSNSPPTTPPFAVDAGPSLGAPPSSFADAQRTAVAQAIDDPNAPGRNSYLAAGQPQLPANSMFAESHAAQRPPDARQEPVSGNGMGRDSGSPNYNSRPYNDGRQQSSNDRFVNDGVAPNNVSHSQHNGQPTNVSNVTTEPPERNWPALMFTVTLLLASLSGNVYLFWLFWDTRLRYRDLLSHHDSLALSV